MRKKKKKYEWLNIESSKSIEPKRAASKQKAIRTPSRVIQKSGIYYSS